MLRRCGDVLRGCVYRLGWVMTGLAIGCMIWAAVVVCVNLKSKKTIDAAFRVAALLVLHASVGYLIEAMV
jgi:hypothetical protein